MSDSIDFKGCLVTVNGAEISANSARGYAIRQSDIDVVMLDGKPRVWYSSGFVNIRLREECNNISVPAGWKLVPVEPTEAMIGALSRALFEDDSYLYSDMAVNAYNVMILAAPDFKESAQ